MKIKTKLSIGVGLLFLMILLLSVLSSWYINQLKQDTNNILTANYNTLEYSRNMLLSLEDIPKDPLAVHSFEKHLEKQKKNITEVGEKEATENLILHFNALQKNTQDAATYGLIRKDITELMQLNMQAIEHKSDVANKTAQNAIVAISVAGTLCFLLAFILLVNLPSSIANPIVHLTESIKQIANQNYKERVHFESHNEYGELARSFNVMAEKIQFYSESKLEKIIKGKKRIEALVDALNDAVIGIDEDKKILFINDIALQIMGLKRENAVGQQIQDIALNNDLMRDIIKNWMPNTHADNHNKTLKIFANGKESYFEKEMIDIHIKPTAEDQKIFIGQVILLKNITPFKELDIAKTHFLGTVSHEFKTPISSIQLGLQLLENDKIGSLNSEQQKLVTSIKEDASRLLNITSELLNITQVESGALQINPKPTLVNTIISYAVQANQASAMQKNIELKIQSEQDDLWVYADGEKTAWVLNNLLSNAIRYSLEKSSIIIRVVQSQDKILFSVQDFGRGIEDQYLPKIFDKYFRIPGTKKEGTGLGLNICKEFIEAQGGAITVQSQLGSGSIFTIQFNQASQS